MLDYIYQCLFPRKFSFMKNKNSSRLRDNQMKLFHFTVIVNFIKFLHFFILHTTEFNQFNSINFSFSSLQCFIMLKKALKSLKVGSLLNNTWTQERFNFYDQ